MFSNWIRNLVGRKSRALADRRRSARRTPFLQLRLEVLEDRLVPALLTWTGAQDNLWNTNFSGSTNWSGNAIPQDGDDLVFPAGVANRTNTNNITGLDLNSIAFSGINYVIGGNAITLNTANDLSDTSIAGANALNLNITLSVDSTINVAQASTTLTLGGVLSGAGDVNKAGPGVLLLTQANTYTGATNVNAGTILNGAVNALPTGSDLAVLAGAVYDLNGFNQAVASLTGAGTVTNSSSSTAATLTIKPVSSDQFDGVLSGNLSLTKTGAGTETLAGANANTFTGTTTVNDGTLNLNKTGAVAIPGDLVIGDTSSGALSDAVQLQANNQLAATSNITMNADGILGFNAGVTQTIATLTMVGGAVDSVTGLSRDRVRNRAQR